MKKYLLASALVASFILVANHYAIAAEPAVVEDVAEPYVAEEEFLAAEDVTADIIDEPLVFEEVESITELPPVEIEDNCIVVTVFEDPESVVTSEEPEVVTEKKVPEIIVSENPVKIVPEVTSSAAVRLGDPTNEVDVLSNLLYGEAGGVVSTTNKAAVVWCVLNRYDAGGYGNSIIAVATASGQFYGYNPNRVITDSKEIASYYTCREIVEDVLARYYTAEQEGRVLPKDYLWFSGNGVVNKFRNEYKTSATWDWSLPSPYAN